MIRKICSFFLLMSLLWSCDSMQSKNKKNIPESIGSENNIIVVTDSSVWTSGIKGLLSDNFEKNYPVLNQPEPHFKLLDIKFVELNSLLKRSKIIFFISLCCYDLFRIVLFSMLLFFDIIILYLIILYLL